MISKKITIEVKADNEADFAAVEKALNVYASAFSPKEHDKLRMTILYDKQTMGLLRAKLKS